MKRFKFKILAIIIIGVLFFSGCTSNNTVSNNNIKNNNTLTIASSFYPIYIFLLNIAKDVPNVKVVNMTKPTTGCLHDYSLTTDDMKTLDSAQIFVINGAGMESFMDKVTKQMPNLKIVDSSKNIQLIKGKGDIGDNPHIWVSISNAIVQVKNISCELQKLDPKNAQKYKQNTDEYVKKLQNERNKMHKELNNIKTRDIITFHEAFPYFAKEFNLNIVSVIQREPGSEPSAKEIQETIEKVKKLNVKALFAEPQYSPKAAQTIANETGAKLYTLDPVVTGEDDMDAYIKIMDKNLEVLKEALE